jgi:diguanylate cyclase (GGDEF)-like protein
MSHTKMGLLGKRALATFGKQQKALQLTVGLALVVVVGLADSLTTWEVFLSPFYLFPIALITYYSGKRAGQLIALTCATSWLLGDVTNNLPHSHPVFLYINFVIRCVFFLTFVSLFDNLKRLLVEVRALADTDGLTKVLNRRSFFEAAGVEVTRTGRYGHPFTIAYVDLDSFKQVNDTLGHEVGDKLLCVVADTIRKNLRGTDAVARVGGDEFVILLSETDYASADGYLRKVQRKLRDAMGDCKWDVTFSIGAVTFVHPPDSVEAMVKTADNLMYSAKHNGKNQIRHEST